jgi:hypothetical protein
MIVLGFIATVAIPAGVVGHPWRRAARHRQYEDP